MCRAYVVVEPASIDAIFITHEHSDHVSGLGTWLRKYPCKVYSTVETLNAILHINSLGRFGLTADYAIPVYAGDISWFSPVAYIRNFLLIPHVDGTVFPVTRGDRTILYSLLSAGADLTVELGNFCWVPYPCSVGISASWLGGPYFKTLAEAAENGRKPYYVGLLFSFDI